MKRGRSTVIGKKRVSIRVLVSKQDYESLRRIAKEDRTDISSVVRRAIARYYFVPGNHNADKQASSTGFGGKKRGQRELGVSR